MSFMSRLLSGMLLFAALLASLVGMSLEHLSKWFAPRDSFGDCVSLLEEQRKRGQLDRALKALWEREYNKEMVADELLNGELSLFEAAAWFRSIHEQPFSWPDPIHPRPGHDEGERWCRLVIDYMHLKVRFEQSLSQADALSQRWEAALQEQRERHGAVKLPS